MTGLADQLWIGRRAGPPRPERLKAVSYGTWRKPHGCLWTSTYDERYGSGWHQYCITDRGSERDVTWGWLLTPDPDALIFTVDDYDDLADLHERFASAEHMDDVLGPRLDWSAIAQEYDAVHLTEDGQWRTRLSHPLDLYGWDCESTVWFRWMFLGEPRALGETTFASRYDDEETAA